MKYTHDNELIKMNFLKLLQEELDTLNRAISTQNGDWVIKGFIDIAKNIYTISADTKVISKIMELLIFPSLCNFAKVNNYNIELSKEQNHYPDLTFIDNANNKFAVDIKTTYRKNEYTTNGMTLGAFTGYFRNRESTKNTKYPYQEYAGHIVLGIIYSRSQNDLDERAIYNLTDLQKIKSVIGDFTLFAQEKHKIATDRPGSGNTKNIGSISNINDLINGNGPFTPLGEDVFNDYWMYYLTKEMAKAAELQKPLYRNLDEYKEFKNLK